MQVTECPFCNSADLREVGLNSLVCRDCKRSFVGSSEQISAPHRHGDNFGGICCTTPESVSESEDHTRVFVIGILLGWFFGLVSFIFGAIIWGN